MLPRCIVVLLFSSIHTPLANATVVLGIDYVYRSRRKKILRLPWGLDESTERTSYRV